jgi:hypothetical protein
MKNKSGLADSPFFQASPQPIQEPKVDVDSTQTKPEKVAGNGDVTTPRRRDTMASRRHDATTPKKFAVDEQKLAETLKEVGRERTSLRMTEDEKAGVAQIVYNLRAEGVKLSENDVFRVALNFVLEDYEFNTPNSLIESVLKKKEQ